MSNIVALPTIDAFTAEFTKEAVNLSGLARHGGRLLSQGRAALRSPKMHSILGGASGGAGAGGLVGGVLGAGEGAVRGYREAKEQGAPTGQALSGALSGALQTGSKRSLQGALAGAALGGGGAGLQKDLPGKLNVLPYVGAGSRFGQRQLHSLTGWTPKGGVQAIRGGAYSAGQNVEKTRDVLRQARKKGTSVPKAKKELSKAREALEASTKAEQMGLTSLPGYAKALRADPKAALRAGFEEQYKSMGPGLRALTYGGTAASVGGELTRDDPTAGRLERTGRSLGAGLPFLAGPLPLAATMVAGPALSAGLGAAGKGVDKVTGALTPKQREQS